jgi:hypothetical protein
MEMQIFLWKNGLEDLKTSIESYFFQKQQIAALI